MTKRIEISPKVPPTRNKKGRKEIVLDVAIMSTMSSSNVAVYTTPPESLIKHLEPHLPYSLPLIRRLRFAQLFKGGITKNTRIVYVTSVTAENDEEEQERDDGGGGSGEDNEVPFAAGYLDFSRGPETELWIYSSLERAAAGGKDAETVTEEAEVGSREREATACALALLREVKRQQDLYFGPPDSQRARERVYPTLLVGNLGESLRLRLADPATGVVFTTTGIYDKWLFTINDLPDIKLPSPPPSSSGEGEWSWGMAKVEDIPFMLSRSHIERKVRTMKLLASTVLYCNGKPIAWAFLGPDSSLSSLHCEEPYRGKGIAKAVAIKILRDHLKEYGNESPGYGWADVDPANTQSQGVCRSLRGQVRWQISW
ncbi:hypothetical protein F5Y16DRAFT_11232 [Xylariaceae sp. FL0255]|nr:hypothetical protein F5Y16DRAFT_11232 [Xylariaceae sp. FL0255]